MCWRMRRTSIVRKSILAVSDSLQAVIAARISASVGEAADLGSATVWVLVVMSDTGDLVDKKAVGGEGRGGLGPGPVDRVLGGPIRTTCWLGGRLREAGGWITGPGE